MNRRHFLASLAATASGLLAPAAEPVRRYFFAPAGGWAPRAYDHFGETVGGVALRTLRETDPLGAFHGGVWWPGEILHGYADAAPFINALLERGRAFLPPATLRIATQLVVPKAATLDGGCGSVMLVEHTGPAIIAYESDPGDRPTEVSNIHSRHVTEELGECGLQIVRSRAWEAIRGV